MDEESKNIFADMFAKEENENPESPAEETKKESKAPEKTDDAPKEETPMVEKDFPKKDTGIGGSAFADEFLAFAKPEHLEAIRSGKRTIHGFFNWAYSHAKNAYVKANGRTDGGIFMPMGELIRLYFETDIAEGTVENEVEYTVKPKFTPPPAPPAPPKTEKKRKTKTKEKPETPSVIEPVNEPPKTEEAAPEKPAEPKPDDGFSKERDMLAKYDFAKIFGIKPKK